MFQSEIEGLTLILHTSEALQAVQLNEFLDDEVFLKLLSLDYLNIQEIDLFLYSMKWIEAHPKSQINAQIIQKMRFGAISFEDLVNRVKPFVPRSVPIEVYVNTIRFDTLGLFYNLVHLKQLC